MLTLLIFLAFVTAFLYYEFVARRKGLPPGPIPFLIVGNALQLGQGGLPHETLFKWSRRYGSVFTCWLGNQPNVVITDYNIIKEYVGGKDAEAFSGRADNELLLFANGGR